MRHRLYLHLTWTTRDRERLLNGPIARLLHRFVPAVARQERAQVLALGIVMTHVHVLLRVDPATVIPRLVQRLKGGTAVIAAREGHSPPGHPLRWARGYNVESVGSRALPQVREYVDGQARRHPDEAIDLEEAGSVGRQDRGARL
jgi:REP element-mobilizing transposase RayT